MHTDNFFRDLPKNNFHVLDLLTNTDRFTELPDDWYIVITDIQGSTKLYEEGRHRETITVGARSMEVIHWIAQENNIDVPSVFGGDGATVVVPPSIHEKVINALVMYRQYVEEEHGMHLRVGSVPMNYLKDMGHSLRVARCEHLPYCAGAVFLDTALSYADKAIKNNPEFQHTEVTGDAIHISFKGIDQIWEPIHVPEDSQSSLCLLINATDHHNHAPEYKRLLEAIHDIAGDPHEVYGYLYEHNEIIEGLQTDALNFDGMLKTVLVTPDEQAKQLLEFLDKEESEGRITFGHHISSNPVLKIALTTGKDMKTGIIDIGEGGYVEASKVLKAKKEHIYT